MREPSHDYRTPATPKPVVVELSAASVGEGPLLALAGLFTVAAIAALLIGIAVGSLLPLLIGLVIAIFARYGRTVARVSCLPRSGEIEIETRGFLAASTTRRIRTGDIHAARLSPLTDQRLAIPPMDMLVLELTNGRIEHVFGRPLGLPPKLAEALRTTLSRAIDAARSEALPVRVALGDEALDAALGGTHDCSAELGDEEEDRPGKQASRRALRRGRPRPR